MEDSVTTLARRHGFAIVIYPCGGESYNLFYTKQPQISDEKMLRVSTSILLSKLRDNHPDPGVADKAVDLLVALQAYSREVE